MACILHTISGNSIPPGYNSYNLQLSLSTQQHNHVSITTTATPKIKLTLLLIKSKVHFPSSIISTQNMLKWWIQSFNESTLSGTFILYPLSLCFSEEACDNNYTMCPTCDRKCPYWNYSESCRHVTASQFFDNDATVVFTCFMCIWGRFSFWHIQEPLHV